MNATIAAVYGAAAGLGSRDTAKMSCTTRFLGLGLCSLRSLGLGIGQVGLIHHWRGLLEDYTIE
jgi:hypothetical protein